MIHFTKWNKADFELNKVYETGSNETPYWTGKLNQDYSTQVKPFYTVIEEFLLKSEQDISDPLFENFKNEFLKSLKNSLVPLIEHGKFSSELLKEYIFEEVRMDSYPSLPSRRRCLFLSEDTADVESIRSTFSLNDSLYLHVIRVVPVSDESTTFTADAKWLNCDLGKYDLIKDHAHSYWSGKISSKPMMEILLVGKFQIIEIIK